MLVARIHHCIADGIALVRVMLGMTDDAPGTAQSRRRPRRQRPRHASRLPQPIRPPLKPLPQPSARTTTV